MQTNPDPAGCGFCQAPLTRTFVDLRMSPLCQSHLDAGELNGAEEFYPLRVFVCERCLLVQLQQYVLPETIFSEYAYFSSFVDTLARETRPDYLFIGPWNLVDEIVGQTSYIRDGRGQWVAIPDAKVLS